MYILFNVHAHVKGNRFNAVYKEVEKRVKFYNVVSRNSYFWINEIFGDICSTFLERLTSFWLNEVLTVNGKRKLQTTDDRINVEIERDKKEREVWRWMRRFLNENREDRKPEISWINVIGGER